MDTTIQSMASGWATSLMIDALIRAGIFTELETQSGMAVGALARTRGLDEEYLRVALRSLAQAGFVESIAGETDHYRSSGMAGSLQGLPGFLRESLSIADIHASEAMVDILLHCLRTGTWPDEGMNPVQAEVWGDALLFPLLAHLLETCADKDAAFLADCPAALATACHEWLDQLGLSPATEQAHILSLLSDIRCVLAQLPVLRELPALLGKDWRRSGVAITAYENELRAAGKNGASLYIPALAEDGKEQSFAYPERGWAEKPGALEPPAGLLSRADQACRDALEALRVAIGSTPCIVTAFHAEASALATIPPHDGLPFELRRRYLSTAPAFLMYALGCGLFPDREHSRLTHDGQGNIRRSEYRLLPRDYRIRHPHDSDLEDLLELDRISQPEAMHTPFEELKRRVQAHPHSILVLEADGRVVAALYAQRMDEPNALEKSCYAEAGALRREDGRYVQLLGLYVRPDMADRGYADALIESMLSYAATLGGVEQVIGVTRCASFREYRDGDLRHYIHACNEQGEPLDPMLHFHVSHGAVIDRVIPGFRPADLDNEGAGILVRYDLLQATGTHDATAPESRLSAHHLESAVRNSVLQVLGEARAQAYDKSQPLMSMGLSSLELLDLRRLLSAAVARPLEATFFFKYGTPESIISYLEEQCAAATAIEEFVAQPLMPEQEARESAGRAGRIAIIGMACRLPGDIRTPEQLHEVLLSGKAVIGPLPESRQHLQNTGDSFRWPGGFLEDVDSFDAAFFRISPREAEWIDPQQRLLLEVAWETLESAAIAPSGLRGSKSGIFVGMMGSDYSSLLAQLPAKSIDAYFSTGNACAVAAGRLAYCLDWQGPALTIDTACSSSMVAVHNACRSLLSGECDLALAAGVNLLLDARRFEAFADAGMLSPDGCCKTFDDAADGYGRSEGCVVIALKRLEDAEAAGDRVLAVIEATAINQDGASSGLTAPNQRAQENLIASALSQAGIRPDEVGYLEAHGTGTSLGDPIEVMAASAVLGTGRSNERPLLIGSVKSGLGHLEAAAGITGLVATVMKMRHRILPGQVHFSRPNHHIPWSTLPVRVVEQTRVWPDYSDLACVSSFGFSGTNAHAIVRAHAESRGEPVSVPGPQLIVLSARTEADLLAMAKRLSEHLIRHPENLFDLARTLQLGRDPMSHRLAIVASSLDALVIRLQAFCEGKGSAEDMFFGVVPRDHGDSTSRAADDDTQRALQPGNQAHLAEAWSRGAVVDWSSLHQGLPWKRITLPTYPFARQRHWLPEFEAVVPDHAPVSSGAGAGNSEVRQTLSLTGKEWFLRDHIIGGRPLVPAVVQLAWVRAAAVALGGGMDDSGIALEQVSWPAPMAITAPTQVVLLFIPEGNDCWRFEIRQVETVCCRGTLRRSRAMSEAQVDTRAALRDCTEVCEPADLYRHFAALGLSYGNGFRAIRSLHRQQGKKAVAYLSLPADRNLQDEQWPPSLLDGALQACIAVMNPDSTLLPFALESIQSRASLPESVRVHVLAASDDGPHLRKWDITLCDEQDQVVMRLSGFSLRAAKPVTGMALGETFLAPRWLPDKAEVTDAWPAPIFLTLDGSAPEQLTSLLAGAPQLEHLAWMVPADRAGQEPVDDALHIIRALIAGGHAERALTLSIITRQGAAVWSGEPANGGHAALHGLAGSLSREYPQWRIRVLDLPETATLDGIDWQSRPAATDGEPQAWRAGTWYRRNLLPCALRELQPEETVFRDGGVYVLLGGAGGIGTAFSEYLIRRYKAQLVWLGRRAEDDAIRAARERLSAFGPKPVYLRADGLDPESLELARMTVQERFGRIHGVVHGTIVLADSALATMDDARFAAAFQAKARTALNLDAVFGNEVLDFQLFFSSMQSFSTPAGQANYVAGCCYADALAGNLAELRPYPVKVMHWGYWGSVGVVADDTYRQRMARAGFASIEPDEAMAALERFLQSPLNELVYARTLSSRGVQALVGDTLPSSRIEFAAASVARPLPYWRHEALVRSGLIQQELETRLARLLQGLLAHHDWLDETRPPSARYARWQHAALQLLPQDAPGETEWSQLWQEWADYSRQMRGNPVTGGQIELLDAVLPRIEEILRDHCPATEVMFPQGTLDLVGKVYRGNEIADAFNRILADRLQTYVEQRFDDEPEGDLRILEIGAGTGGTSVDLFARLQPFAGHVAEYAFTDLSAAFLLHAQEHFSEQAPYLRTGRLDIERDPLPQGFEPATYDIVVATNVLHATKDIRSTLQHCKMLLKDKGLLLLNELSSSSVFMHLTFGLLDGWWLAEDLPLRIPGTPALVAQTWRRVLHAEGFTDVDLPAENLHGLGQQVITAMSDGVLLVAAGQGSRKAALSEPVQVVDEVAPVTPQTETTDLHADVLATVTELAAGHLKLPANSLDANAALSDFGFDSITLTSFANLLNIRYGLALSPTVLFEAPTLAELTRYLLQHHREVFARVFASSSVTSAGRTADADIPDDSLREQISHLLRQLIAAHLKLPIETLEGDTPLSDFGFDSITLTSFGNLLNVRHQLTLSPTVFFEAPTINALAAYLIRERKAQLLPLLSPSNAASDIRQAIIEPVAVTSPSAGVAVNGIAGNHARAQGRPEPIAIIGMSGRFPGAADIDTLWRNLRENRESIGELPENRMGPAHQPDVRWAGIIDGIDRFDPMFFNISPREALAMDPQQRLLMECVYHVIEDAGYSVRHLAGSRTALLVGVCNSGYGRLLELAGEEVEGYSAAGVSGSIVTNRMSYWLDWHGPSEPIDTACSSSLVAIHRAVELLRSGQCEQAVAGGVNLLLSATMHDSFARAGMLSRSGRCRTFSAAADGYVRAEGIGLLMLKPLSAAERDGDHIYGLVTGSAENHGGRATSLTAPNPNAQAALIVEAVREAGIDPSTIGYIETHGTATPLGDPIEIQGLRQAFRQLGPDTQAHPESCGLGSVKSNLGHLELAAGVAGVFKVLLQLRHKELVATLNSQPGNPHIDLSDTPFYVVSENRPWEAPVDGSGKVLPRRAGVSSFGFGGVNAHLVLEEYRDERVPCEEQDGAVIVPLSARNEERLQAQARRLLEHLTANAVNPGDLAYTLQVGREPMETRMALVVRSRDELIARLGQYLENPDDTVDNLYRGDVHVRSRGVSLFAADEDLQQAVARWFDKGKLARLAELWVDGIELDWSRLAGNRGRRRLSLPGYPFAEERYWVSFPAWQPHARPVEMLHPLLQRNTSTLFEQSYSTTLTHDHWLLRDHVVHGIAIVPGVAQLEWARAAACLALGDAANERRISLEQVSWVSPLTVEQSLEVQLRLTPQDDDRFAFCLQESGGARIFSRGIVRLDEAGEAPRIDMTALAEDCRQEVSKELLYEQLEQRYGLQYGDTFKLLGTVRSGDDCVVADLAQPASDMRQQYAWPPGFLDSALQASIRLTDSHELALPFALGAIEQWGALPTPAHVIVLPAADDSPAVRKWDIAITDGDGVVALRFRSFCARVFRSADATETLLVIPGWRASEETVAAPGEHAAMDRVLFCECSAPAEVIMAFGAETIGQLSAEGDPARQYEGHLEQLMHELQRLARISADTPKRLQVIVRDEPVATLQQGLASALRSARTEQPNLLGQLLIMDDLDTISGQVLLERLQHEAGSLDALVRYRHSLREVPTWREAEAGSAEPVWRDGGIYWITGGLGGLGLLLAEAIAERVERPVLILTGRNSPGETAGMRLQRLTERGAVVETHCVDVADEPGMQALVAAIGERHGSLNGVLHCAGTIQDHLLEGITDLQLSQVLRAKVSGTRILDRVTQQLPLDWMIVCSSVVSLWGNIGQFAYAAANGYLDQFAHHRQSLVARGERHGRTVSLNWPLWAEGGMQVDEETRNYLQRTTGMTLLPTGDGLNALERALGLGAAQVAILHGERARLLEHLAQADTFASPLQSFAETAATGDVLAENLEKLLREKVIAHLKLSPAQVRVDTPFIRLGFDSVMLTSFSHALSDTLGVSLSPTVFFEAPSIRELAVLLARKYPEAMGALCAVPEQTPRQTSLPPVKGRLATVRLAQPEPQASRPALPDTRHEAIAVIGMSGRFPGAENIGQLWRNLREGRDCVGTLPAGRWGSAAVVTVEHAAVLDDIDCFDPLFFGISPREARAMDPQQRLLMEGVYQVVEDAGYSSQSLSGTDTALLIGMTHSGFGQMLAESGEPVSGYSAAGVTSSMGPNRISYWLNWTGPSEPIDTACSSSLVAIHRAVELLRSGRCSQAVAGGVNLLLSAQIHESFAQAGMLSKDGRCRTFSAGANGYVRGEGIGLLFLKPLSAAERDGDHIYGLIAGSAENHGGKSASLTAPNPTAQARVITAAIRDAGVKPESIGYIEAHGTGTPLGDPVEIQGLKQAFEQLRDADGQAIPSHCALGSIKSNIGHLELAAGVAGVIKTLLQLRHAQRVPSLNAMPLNPEITLDETPFHVVTENEQWPVPHDRSGQVLPRCAGVSSFGFGGVNAHVLVQEYQEQEAVSATTSGPCLIPLSARTEAQLQARLLQLRDYLDAHDRIDLPALAYTLQVGRDPLEERLVLIVDDSVELRHTVQALCRGEAGVAGVLRGHHDADPGAAPEREVLLRYWQSKDLTQLANWWLEGRPIDWSALYGRAHPRRLALPVYPFARERYWLRERPEMTVKEALHPLVHRNVSTLEQIRFITSLSANDWFLREHTVQGRPTVPGVVQLEWARAAIQLAVGRSDDICLKEVVWLRPLQVESALDACITLMPGNDGAIRYEIHAGSDTGSAPCSRGIACFDNEETGVRPFHDVSALLERCTQQVAGADLYARQAASGLVHGQRLRGLQQLYLHDGGAVASLRGTAVAADGLVWRPGLLDAALLACAGMRMANGLALPFAVRSVSAWGDLSAAVWAVIEPVAKDQDGADCWNITLADSAGHALLRFEHFSIRRQAAEKSVRPLLFAPVWRTQKLAE